MTRLRVAQAVSGLIEFSGALHRGNIENARSTLAEATRLIVGQADAVELVNEARVEALRSGESDEPMQDVRLLIETLPLLWLSLWADALLDPYPNGLGDFGRWLRHRMPDTISLFGSPYENRRGYCACPMSFHAARACEVIDVAELVGLPFPPRPTTPMTACSFHYLAERLGDSAEAKLQRGGRSDEGEVELKLAYKGGKWPNAPFASFDSGPEVAPERDRSAEVSASRDGPHVPEPLHKTTPQGIADFSAWCRHRVLEVTPTVVESAHACDEYAARPDERYARIARELADVASQVGLILPQGPPGGSISPNELRDLTERWCVIADAVAGGRIHPTFKPPAGVVSPTEQASPPARVVLDATELHLLRVLADALTTMVVADVTAAMDDAAVSERTAGERLKRLNALGLIDRPRGPRKGYAITDAGRDRLADVRQIPD